MARTPRTMLLGVLVCAGLFAVLLTLAYWSDAVRWLDNAALQGFSAQGGRLEHYSARFVRLGDPLPVAFFGLLLAGFALLRARPRIALAVVFLIGATSISSQTLKAVLAFPREPLAPASFPSGHTTAAMTLALCLMLVTPRRLRPLAAVVGLGFALAMGMTLLLTTSHFASDVLGGLLLATGWTLLVVAALLAAEARWPERSGRTGVASVARRVGDAMAAVGLTVAAVVGFGVVLLLAGFVLLTRLDDVVAFVQDHTAAVGMGLLIVCLAGLLLGGMAAVLRRGA